MRRRSLLEPLIGSLVFWLLTLAYVWAVAWAAGPVASPQGVTPDQINWLGYFIYAVEVPGLKEPVVNVDTRVDVGLSQRGDSRIHWRSQATQAPTTLTCPGIPSFSEDYTGPTLAAYPWRVPPQPRTFLGMQVCLHPDGTVRWRWKQQDQRTAVPDPLGILSSGFASTTGRAVQIVPWFSYAVRLDTPTAAEGYLLWQTLTPTP